MNRFIPLGKNLLVKSYEEPKEETKKGLLIMPESSKKKDNRYVVMEVSSELNTPIEVGYVVVCGGYRSHEIEIEEQKYFIIGIDDVLGILGTKPKN